MANKLPNPRLIKINRSYTVEEAAAVCGKHKNTIRAWLKNGLPTCDQRRPTLILGLALREYLEAKRKKHKSRLSPGEIYCVKCRMPRKPDSNYAVLEGLNEKVGNLMGVCPACDTIIYRRVSYLRWRAAIGDLEVSIPQALEQLVKGYEPSPNCYLKQGT